MPWHPALNVLWAKTGKAMDGSTVSHPLTCHLLDVAAVSTALWETVLPEKTRRLFRNAFGLDDKATGRFLAILAPCGIFDEATTSCTAGGPGTVFHDPSPDFRAVNPSPIVINTGLSGSLRVCCFRDTEKPAMAGATQWSVADTNSVSVFCCSDDMDFDRASIWKDDADRGH